MRPAAAVLAVEPDPGDRLDEVERLATEIAEKVDGLVVAQAGTAKLLIAAEERVR